MPRAGLFWKLFFSTALLCIAAAVALLLAFSSNRRETLRRQFDNRLHDAAVLLREMTSRDWPARPTPSWQQTLRRAAQETGIRLTVIAADGSVLGDSEAAELDALNQLENLASRVEIVQAKRMSDGWSTRRRPGSEQRHRYYALRIRRDDRVLGYVRAAMPLATLQASIAQSERRLWLLGLAIALLATAGSYALAASTTRPLIAIQQAAEAIAQGDYQRRLPYVAQAHDEISRAAQSLYDVGQRLAQQERELRRSSQTQATVLEAMTEGVLAIDRDFRVLFANRSAAAALELGTEKLLNATLLQAVRNHDLQELAEQVLATGKVSRQSWQWQGRHTRIYDVLATPLPGEPCRGVVLVLRDVSEVKRLEEMRQQFVANVSHELKTPLSSIKAYTETLLGGAVDADETRNRFLAHIDEQADRLHELIRDMLSLARIESGQANLEQVRVPVARLVATCLADYQQRADAHQVSLQNHADDPGLSVRGDEESVRQILDNLVDNALKYTPSGGRVTVRARQQLQTVQIEVSDTGIGIAREHHDRLFERFYRVDKARSRALGGTGLGLAIVKHLCQAMGGTVAIDSQLGTGSVFRVTLPASQG